MVMLTTGILGKLHRDHEAASRLMGEINELIDTGSADYGELFAELRIELLAHAKAEERVFYAALEEHEECRDDIKDGREEHDEIEEILNDLERTEDEEEWVSTFQELEEAVEHHVREEEAETFAIASRLLGKEKLQQLAERFTREKARARAELTGEEDEEEESEDELRLGGSAL